MDIVSVIKVITAVNVKLVVYNTEILGSVKECFANTNFKVDDISNNKYMLSQLTDQMVLVLTDSIKAVEDIRSYSSCIPIIYLVAGTSEAIVDIAELQVDGYIMVPFDTAGFISTLLRIIPNIYDLFAEHVETKNVEFNDKWLSAIASNIYEGAIIVNENYEIVFINRASCEILGYQSEELLGKHLSVVSEDFCVGMDKFALTGAELVSDVMFKHKQVGRQVDVSTHVKVITQFDRNHLLIFFEKKSNTRFLDERLVKQVKMQRVVVEFLNGFIFKENYKEYMYKSMQLLGEILGAVRIIISQTIVEDGDIFGRSKPIFDWSCSGISAEDIPQITEHSWDDPAYCGLYKDLLHGSHSILLNKSHNLVLKGFIEHLSTYSKVLTIPITIHGEFWGHMMYFFKDYSAIISQYDINVATSIATSFGLGIYNNKLMIEQEERQAQISHDLERSARFEKVKTDFLSNMNHEMRTPLSSMLGFAELLSTTDIDYTQKHYLDMIISSSKVLMNIIDDVIEVSRYEKGDISIKNLEFPVFNELDSIIQLFTSQTADAGHHFIFYVDLNIPYYLLGDPLRIKQALSFLVANAIKFTSTGGFISFEVALVNKTDDVCTVNFSISDTGIGIPDDKKEEMNQLFSETSDIVEKGFAGIGLGLTLFSKIIKALGGKANVASFGNVGSIFSFELSFVIPKYPENVAIVKQIKSIKLAHNSFEASISEERDNLYRFIDSIGCNSKTFYNVQDFENLNFKPDFIFFQFKNSNLGLLKTLLEIEHDAIFIVVARQEDLVNLSTISKYGNVYIAQLPIYISVVSNMFRDFGKRKIDEINGVKANSNVKYRLKVLLADNNKVNRELISVILSQFDIIPDLAYNGKQALDIFKLKEYDLILMDMNMPIMNGNESIIAIRDFEKETQRKRSKIFALIPTYRNDIKDACKGIDIDDFLKKPINKVMVDDILRRHFMNMQDEKASNNNQVCDIGQLVDNLGVDKETAFMLIEMFIDGLDEALEPVNEYILNNNLSALHLEAHKLKGSSRNLGFEVFGMMCHDIEQNAKNGNADVNYKDAYTELANEGARIKAWYSALKK